MKCINKILSILLSLILIVSLGGCKGRDIPQKFSMYKDSVTYGLLPDPNDGKLFFSSDKCIGTRSDTGESHADISEGYGAFDDTSLEVKSSHNIMEKMYPASTTKVLTAYIALTSGNPEQIFTVSENAINTTVGSSTSGLIIGDKIALSDLMYGLMLNSGNDAAVTIAEGISGSVEDFAALMNRTARSLGATHSNFVNPHGLPDDNHYTCIYDMYLIFHAALDIPEFVKIIKTAEKNVKYSHSNGSEATAKYTNTNWYLSGNAVAPKGIRVIGGKTGTTNAAGYCLILYSKRKSDKHELVSIVYKASSRDGLYDVMTKILEESKK
ncbi:MAG: D-alanyl-D-alanine carboxypeptidase [Lachnospiraceae bacterium]|nr:D-alanyl-D-alanine carboxypeptidase [Lachnospiraceae bacterium]